jgi:hypothetical protein
MYNGNNQPYATITNSIFKNSVWNGASGLAYRLCAWDIVKAYHTTNSDFSTIYDFRPNTAAYGGIGGGTFGYNTYYKNCLIFLGHNNTTVPIWNNPGQHSGQIIKNNCIMNGTAGFIASYENCTQFGNHSPTYIYNNIFVNNSGTLFSNICGSTSFAFMIENNYMHNCSSIGITSGNTFDSSRWLNINNYVLPKSPFKDYVNYNLLLNDDAQGGKTIKFDTVPTLLSPSNTSKNKDVGPIQNSILPAKINMNGGMRG